MKLYDRINEVKFNLIFENKFLGYLILYLQVKFDDKIKSFATDGTYIYINEKYAENLTDEEIKFLFLHEIYHIILGHIFRASIYGYDENYDNATDIVVNSCIIEKEDKENEVKKIANKYSHINDIKIDGIDGKNWTAEQIYNYIKDKLIVYENVDDHSLWRNKKEFQDENLRNEMRQRWQARISNVGKNISSKDFGNLPNQIKREVESLLNPVLDWRVLLKDFIEEEITDYSFNPPDKRNIYSDFLLPDFNEVEEKICDIFFFVDVSGSMSDEQIDRCKNEIKGCIEQYNGKIEGYLGYFDYKVSVLQSFNDETEMLGIEAIGGGGTSFENIFNYLNENQDKYSATKKKIIILTDGYATFPSESLVGDYELLWIINNEEVTPTIGEVARLLDMRGIK